MLSKSKRRRIVLDDYSPHVENTLPNPTTLERHTHFSSGPQRLAVRQDYISVPTSPVKRSAAAACNPPANLDEPVFRTELFDETLPAGRFDNDITLDDTLAEDGQQLSGVEMLEQLSERRKRNLASENPLLAWVPYIDTYLEEVLRLEGCGDARKSCGRCAKADASPIFRCRDCHDQQLYCRTCIVNLHQAMPFHRIDRWDVSYFSRTTLKDLGLRIQLGHPLGETCPIPAKAYNDMFVIINLHGIHNVGLDYCACQQANSRPVQLLRVRLWPSTVLDPQTAATFQVLEHFQLLNFTSKISGWEFYRALARQSDNTGTRAPPDRYASFLRMVRQWRHVRLLKRSGRGNDPTGVAGTKEGECAILCPACPYPGINLPEGWEKADKKKAWLYALFLAIDANFRLKRMNVSNNAKDPGLNHGYAYVVEDKRFRNYLARFGDSFEDDTSTCNNHDAVKSATIRSGYGVSTNGLGSAGCSRHDMARPTSLGDLQKGERYINMDYFFLASLAHCLPILLVISYDIACQWFRNLAARCSSYPPNALSPGHPHTLTRLIPKFHLPAHKVSCHVKYNFNYTPHVGRTDGEAPERGWAATNAVANSTKEMGPGSRRDTLDDHFGDYNWRKIMMIGPTFVRQVKEALEARVEQVEAFQEFDAALPTSMTEEWTKMVQDWERDSTCVNPYSMTLRAIKEKDIRLRLAEEDKVELETGTSNLLHGSVSASMLIWQGLELEEQQNKLRSDSKALGPHSTDLQRAKVLERCNALQRKVEAWIEIHHLYMPAVATIRARESPDSANAQSAAFDTKLLLPSAVIDDIRLPHRLMSIEFRLRQARAFHHLDELRGLLLLRSYLCRDKDRRVSGNRMLTKSRAVIESVSIKVNAAVARYRQTHAALTKLAPLLLEVTWSDRLRDLADSDVTGLSWMDDGGAEGRKQVTWIWKVHGSISEDGMDGQSREALRVEWCKARARAHRWQEECLLLDEEMRRVKQFFAWQSKKWNEHATTTFPTINNRRSPENSSLPGGIFEQAVADEGRHAYAHRQAAIRDEMRVFCQTKWAGLSELLLRGSDAAVDGDFVECH